MCMKNVNQGYYPTVILRLCCSYHLVRVRKWPENGIETGREWRGDGLRVARRWVERERCGERLREDRREAKKRKNAEK